jgi:hypothetical protein
MLCKPGTEFSLMKSSVSKVKKKRCIVLYPFEESNGLAKIHFLRISDQHIFIF